MQTADETLMCQIRAQEEAAFEQFYARYRSAMTRHIDKIVRDAVVTEDLVQELFLRVWTRAEQWEDRGTVKAWLYRIGTNLALNHLRSVRRRPQQSLPTTPKALPKDNWNDDDVYEIPAWMIDDGAARPDVAVIDADHRQRFWQTVDSLPAEKREVVRMVYEAEMDLQSVADALAIPTGTVKSRLYHSRRQLADRLEAYGVEWQ